MLILVIVKRRYNFDFRFPKNGYIQRVAISYYSNNVYTHLSIFMVRNLNAKNVVFFFFFYKTFKINISLKKIESEYLREYTHNAQIILNKHLLRNIKNYFEFLNVYILSLKPLKIKCMLPNRQLLMCSTFKERIKSNKKYFLSII